MSRGDKLAEDVAPIDVAVWRTTELWLIRHGESTGNAEGRLQGQADFPLSERGQRQARALSLRLRGTDFAALYASDLSRALDTACAIGEAIGLPVVSDPRLREIDIGTWSGLTADELADRHGDDWRRWCERRDPAYRRGGGESYDDLRQRIAPAIADLVRAHPGEKVCIVSHGGAINTYLAQLLGMSLDNVWRLSQENACINRILPFANPNTDPTIPSGRIIALNDTLHLDGIR